MVNVMINEELRKRKKEFTELETGIMSPEGDFYYTSCMEHLWLAQTIYEELHPSEKAPGRVDEELKKQGWAFIHITVWREHGYIISFYRHLTKEQIRVLKPACEKRWDFIIERNARDLRREFYEDN